VRLKDVKSKRDEIVEQNPKPQRDEIKVDDLRRRPHEPLGGIKNESFVINLLADLFQGRIVKKSEREKEDGEADWREDDLIHHHFFGDHRQGFPRHPSLQHLIPVVTNGTDGEAGQREMQRPFQIEGFFR